eukprot:4360372-Prymnesium_polylepis.1
MSSCVVLCAVCNLHTSALCPLAVRLPLDVSGRSLVSVKRERTWSTWTCSWRLEAWGGDAEPQPGRGRERVFSGSATPAPRGERVSGPVECRLRVGLRLGGDTVGVVRG